MTKIEKHHLGQALTTNFWVGKPNLATKMSSDCGIAAQPGPERALWGFLGNFGFFFEFWEQSEESRSVYHMNMCCFNVAGHGQHV